MVDGNGEAQQVSEVSSNSYSRNIDLKPKTASSIFTGLTGSYGGNYGAPDGFCWDALCSDPQFNMDTDNSDKLKDDHDDIDSTTIDEHNEQIIRRFVDKAREQSDSARGSHLLMTFGSDFQFRQSEKNYRNMDKLVHYLKKGSKWSREFNIEVFYSTMENYLEAKKGEQIQLNLNNQPLVEYP